MPRTNRAPGEFTPRQVKAIELLAASELSLGDICEELNISRHTLWKWRKIPAFRDAVLDRARVLLLTELPSIYSALGKNAANGDPRHIRLVLEHLERLEGRVGEKKDLTFTWETDDNDSVQTS